MALFDVPGWSVPSVPVTEASKKRKRPADGEEDKVTTATINFEKLMAKLEAGNAAGGAAKGNKKAKKEKKGKEGRADTFLAEKGAQDVRGVKQAQKRGQQEKGKEKGHAGATERPNVKQSGEKTSSPAKKRKEGEAVSDPGPSHVTETAEDGRPAKKNKKNKQQKKQANDVEKDANTEVASPQLKAQGSGLPDGLTKLQAGMKNSLDGARFRWINELLYKADSERAHELMLENPKMFEEYHTGFRSQVRSWPTNPVSHYISELSSYPARTVIADLGCGDAALARALVPKGLIVLSYDLVSDGAYVVEADVCKRVPLPGSEPSEGEGQGEAQAVDVVVCALSLMGTNWVQCVREAWRILKPGGELKIAEVASRFANVDSFVSLVSSVGFRLTSRNEDNTHFTLLDFKKVARKHKSEQDWEKLLARGEILKPCEYKRR